MGTRTQYFNSEFLKRYESVYVVSDTHFDHANIMKYCPWRQSWADDRSSMNETMRARWNATVTENDLVIHLGDFAFAGRKRLRNLRESLNGSILLLKGNHDGSYGSLEDAGFDYVLTTAYIRTEKHVIVARHIPQDFSSLEQTVATVLLHGHTHGEADYESFTDAKFRHKYFDASLDAVESIAPFRLDSI